MATTTRLGQIGVGVDAYVGFASKIAASPRGDEQFTRLTLSGIGGWRYVGFVPKGAAAPAPPVVVTTIIGGLSRQPRVDIVRNATADGSLLVATAGLLSGRASGDAFVCGTALRNNISAVEGRAYGDAITQGQLITKSIDVVPGAAEGFDAVNHDNEFLLLAA